MSKKMLSKKNDVSTSIHSIAKQLRGEEIKLSEESKKMENANSSKKLNDLFEVLKSNSYNCKSILYVDDEIKEVFALIKSKEKISISTLVSYILESWIENNLDEITAIINNNTNRFL